MIQDGEMERRKKISQTLKGRVPWNKGLKNWRVISDETKRKIGLAHKGKKVFVSEETRKKISDALKGKTPKNLSYLHSIPFTKQRKQKISLSNTGKRLSLETRKKISDSKRNPLRPLIIAIRQCYRYREWRTEIFKRDNFTCVLCGKRGTELNADHFPKRFVDIIRDCKIESLEQSFDCNELWATMNGRTLCVHCHRQTDTFGFKARSLK